MALMIICIIVINTLTIPYTATHVSVGGSFGMIYNRGILSLSLTYTIQAGKNNFVVHSINK